MTAHDTQTAVTEPEAGAVPAPAHGAEIMVPLNRLKASPRNARKVRHSAAAIEALAASIKAKGVSPLQLRLSSTALERLSPGCGDSSGAEEAARMAGFRKSDMAEAAERLLEGRGWLPVALRVAMPEPKEEEADEEATPLFRGRRSRFARLAPGGGL